VTRNQLKTLLDRFSDASILVVGDFFLDKYLVLDPVLTETSVETGLDAYQIVARRCSPGAVGTVVSNLHALGVGTLYALTVLGEDGEGYELGQGLEAIGVRPDYVIRTTDRFTPTYTKAMMRERGGEREIQRLDVKNRSPLPTYLEDRVIAYLREAVERVQAIVVGDQVKERNCGVITDRVRETLAAIGRERPELFILVDSRAHIDAFRDVVLKCNRREATLALTPDHEGPVDRAEIERIGRALFTQTRRPVCITLSEEGLLLFDAAGCRHIPALAVSDPIDPVGAGDSTTAGLTAAICAGATLDEAALIGNLTASITITQLGTTGTASPEQLLRQFDKHPR